jgi:tripartite-type tricarboxylate transporter receptor subunit TctC
VVPFGAGSVTDILARIFADEMGRRWGQQVIVENRPGAAGNIATELTAKAPPDGYTLVLCNIGSHSITPARFRATLTYDHIRDFSFPVMIGSVPNVFMTHPSLPPRTLREFVAYAKARPGQINFGSSGVGASPHLSIELLNSMTGIKLVHVPYKGAAEALAAAMSGHIETSVGNLAGGPLAAIKAGRVRALGVTTPQRSPQLPEVRTVHAVESAAGDRGEDQCRCQPAARRCRAEEAPGGPGHHPHAHHAGGVSRLYSQRDRQVDTGRERREPAQRIGKTRERKGGRSRERQRPFGLPT